MKRYGNLWDTVCSLENIALAHDAAKKGKRHYREVRMVESEREKYFLEIRRLLVEKQYVNSPYTIMMKHDCGKIREIWKLPYYPDRIIQHAVVRVLEPVWERTLIRDTYASLQGRGVHDGVKRIQTALADKAGTRYCLKMDVKKFYQSIDHGILKQVFRKKIKDKDVLWLLDHVVDSAPGVPIGNYSSQWFANLYLSGFDHWMKEVQGVRYYFRYCDDLVVLGADKAVLHRLRVRCEAYLSGELSLTLKNNWQVFPVASRGIDFLGYRFFGSHTLVRKRIVKNFKRKHRQKKEASMDAYKGWFAWADTYNLRRAYGCWV